MLGDVKLTVASADYSSVSWANDKHIYNVYVTVYGHAAAETGQCVEQRRRRFLDSGGVPFPAGDAVVVSKEQAKAACAGLTDQRANCVTDVRMPNRQRQAKIETFRGGGNHARRA